MDLFFDNNSSISINYSKFKQHEPFSLIEQIEGSKLSPEIIFERLFFVFHPSQASGKGILGKYSSYKEAILEKYPADEKDPYINSNIIKSCATEMTKATKRINESHEPRLDILLEESLTSAENNKSTPKEQLEYLNIYKIIKSIKNG